MKYTTENDGTKRYNKEGSNNIIIEEEFFFGCEFEFYTKESFNIEIFIKELLDISDVDLLVNELTVPKCEGSEYCMHLKKDMTLKDNGFEVSTPKTSYSKLVSYIEEINLLIEKYGYTNLDTGFHIHISTSKKNGINFDFYKFTLLCNQCKLLYIWETRNSYCLNVMDVISCNTKNEAKKKKNGIGKVWNLEKITNNRIEIRTMGGDNYHLKTKQILDELSKYFEIFKETLSKDTEEYTKLKLEHLEKIKKLPKEEIIEFTKIFID